MLQELILAIAVCFYKPGENYREDKYLSMKQSLHFAFSSLFFFNKLFQCTFSQTTCLAAEGHGVEMTTASIPEEVSERAGWLARGELTGLA